MSTINYQLSTINYQLSTINYQPHYKPNQLICGSGPTAVVTGWTVKQSVAKHLADSEYAVIGNLYSATRGISPLIRNLIANPHIRFLVILNATKEDGNAGACTCLLDLLRHGFVKGNSDTGKDCWVVRSSITGYLDLEIEEKAIAKLRQSLIWEEAKSIKEAVNLIKAYSKKEPMKPWGKPLIFPQAEILATTLPGNRYGHRIEGKTIAETWVKILHRIKTTGTIRPTAYDGKWQELIDLIAVVTAEPEDFYFPEPNYLPIDRQFLGEYISQILDDAPLQEGVKYTYGQRLRSWFGKDQIEQVINKLAGDLDSARAVMSLWDVKDYEANDSPPCLNHIWLRVVGDSLSLTATFRSNDMFSAWPANAMGLRALQKYIYTKIVEARLALAPTNHLELTMGPLIIISQSAHIYDDTWEHAHRVIANEYQKICCQREYGDKSGSFTISLQQDRINVEHLTPGSGEVINCYSGKYAQKLYQQIAADCPSLEVEHALYLGTELQKAEIALSNKKAYIYQQDKPLFN